MEWEPDNRWSESSLPDVLRDRKEDGIRPMTPDDLDIVFDIEKRAYEFPWTRGIFRECLRAGYPAWVMERADAVVAYGIISVAASEAHILNLCVDPAWQRRGLGRKMLELLLLAARRLTAESVFLEVRASNHRAAAIYEQAGFRRIGLRKRYYRGPDGQREDAVVLARSLA